MIINQEEIKIAKVARVKCQKSLLFHTRFFFKKQYNRRFVVNHHHEVITDALERVLLGKCKRLIINVAPRYSKTELAVKNFISNGLGLNPAAKFIHLSYSDSLALDNSESVKDLCQSADYQALFPEVQIKKSSKAKEKWYTTVGGGVLARSAGGSVTGFGAGAVDDPDDDIDEFIAGIGEQQGDEHLLDIKYRFGGAIIIDDPIKPEDADSETVRNRVNYRFDSTVRNRVNSRNTPIIIIMQRLHPMDLTGYLQEIEPDEWEVISLPCLYAEDGEMKALWPFKHTVAELYKLKEVNPTVFETQYQQNPKPKEGLLFPEEELTFMDIAMFPEPEYRAAAIDPADEGGDDLAAPYGYLSGNKIYVPEVIFNKDGTDLNLPRCIDMILRNKINHTTAEGNSAWKLFCKQIRAGVQEKNSDCEIRIITNTQNKHTRILAQAAFIRNHFVFRKDYKKIPEYFKFVQQLTSYLKVGKAQHEDAPDSLAELAKYYNTNFAHVFYT